MPPNRSQRAQIGQETLAILERGEYTLPDGTVVSLREQLDACCAATQLYAPDASARLMDELEATQTYPIATSAVSSRTTLAAARALVERYPTVACLNFASAKNPGGGFLSGAQAQEESLARASGLYSALQSAPAFYEYHRQQRSALYSHRVIFSPGVPVFRDDDGQLLQHPWQAAFLTAAAPNAGAGRANEPHNLPLIRPMLAERARLVLAVAAVHRCAALVLGAWGCGVFRNDPAEVAQIFADVLAEPMFRQRFAHIECAVYDQMAGQPALTAFRAVFGG